MLRDATLEVKPNPTNEQLWEIGTVTRAFEIPDSKYGVTEDQQKGRPEWCDTCGQFLYENIIPGSSLHLQDLHGLCAISDKRIDLSWALPRGCVYRTLHGFSCVDSR